jgi:hypothetical protein
MEFDSIKKNKPQLTDYTYLQKVIESKKPVIVEPIEPTLIDKVCDKVKSSFYCFVENNIFIIFLFVIMVSLLIYRYYQYQSIKNKLLAEQAYYGINYESPYLKLYSRDKENLQNTEHFDQSEDIGRKKKDKDRKKDKKIKNKKKDKHNNQQTNYDNQQNTQYDQQVVHNNPNESSDTNLQYQTQYYQNNPAYPDSYNKQHNECIPHLLNMTNDRSLTVNSNPNMSNLEIINSAAYAPHNLHNLNEFHPWKQNQNYTLV